MPKIDTTKIEGYATMTPEQKLEALEAFEYDDGASVIAALRASVTKANGDASKYKRERDTANHARDVAAADNQTVIDTMQNEIKELKRQARQSSYTARLLALGCGDEAARTMAESLSAAELSDERAEALFAGLKSQLEATSKKAKSDAMVGASAPPAGGTGGQAMTLESFRKLPLDRRAEYASSHPEEYRHMYEAAGGSPAE